MIITFKYIYIASVKPWDKPPTTNGYKVTKWCLQEVFPSLSQFMHQTNSLHPGRKCPFPWHPLHLLQKKHFSSQGWRGTWWNRTSGVVIERIAIYCQSWWDHQGVHRCSTHRFSHLNGTSKELPKCQGDIPPSGVSHSFNSLDIDS